MLKSVFKFFLGVFRWTRRSILLIGCIFFLTINVLTLTSGFVHDMLSRSLSSIGANTVADKFNRDLKKNKTHNEDLKKKNGDLKKRNNGLKKSNLGLKKNNIALNQRVSKLSTGKASAGKYGRKITKNTLKTASANLASVPLESIPWAGIAVIVSATAYELHTACENISDVNSMFDEMGIPINNDQNAAIDTCLTYSAELDKASQKIEKKYDKVKKKYEKLKRKFKKWKKKLPNSLKHELEEILEEIEEFFD